MSLTVTPACSKACSDDCLHPNSNKEGASIKCSCVCPWPAPMIDTGFFFVWRATFFEETMIAPPPSETRQQSNKCKGVEIILEFRTSSTVINSLLWACG